jgi:dTDP-6-deoxy-L-talose 4-dehydrogenase (NAD+)
VRVAVTGAAGFVGRYVLAELAERGEEIVAVAGPRHAAERRPRAPARWVTIDVAAPPADAYSALGSPDVVIHLAWAGLPNYRSLHHFATELPLQYRFLDNLVRHGLPALVGVGTCFEYGMQSGAIAADAPTRPTNPYGYAKDALHRQLQFLKAEKPFALTWARLFYVYGDGQAPTSLWSQLNAAVAAGAREFDLSGGEQVRDYLPVAEAARQIVGRARARADRGAINVCSGAPITVRRLVEGWKHERGWPIELNFGRIPYPDYEPFAFWGVPTE